MTVSLALAEKFLELQLIHRGKLRTDSELGYCSFSHAQPHAAFSVPSKTPLVTLYGCCTSNCG